MSPGTSLHSPQRVCWHQLICGRARTAMLSKCLCMSANRHRLTPQGGEGYGISVFETLWQPPFLSSECQLNLFLPRILVNLLSILWTGNTGKISKTICNLLSRTANTWRQHRWTNKPSWIDVRSRVDTGYSTQTIIIIVAYWHAEAYRWTSHLRSGIQREPFRENPSFFSVRAHNILTM